MTRWLRVLAIALAATIALAIPGGWLVWKELAGPAPLAPGPTLEVLENVILVEPDLRRESGRRIALEGGRITKIEASTGGGTHSGAYPGAYVLPGLVDAHAHLAPGWMPGQAELYGYLFLRHGVTSIRVAADAGGGSSLETRAAIERGDFVGPRIASCGPFIDGPGAKFTSAEVVSTADEARAAIERVAAAGYDCVKAYNELTDETLTAVRETAAKHGLPVIGHVPYRLTLEEARLDDTQHMFGFHQRVDADSFRSIEGWFGVDDARVDEVIAFLKREGVAMTTSLVAGRRIARSRESAADPDDVMRRWLPPWYADAIWRIPGGINPGNILPEDRLPTLDRTITHQAKIVPRLYRAGVDLRAGTDCFAPPVLPGVSLQQELEIFVSGGLTPEEALAIATRGSARALGIEGLGRIEEGAPADLLLFAKDPTEDLANLNSLLAVVKEGRIYPRAILDEQEARYRENFDGFVQQRIFTPLLRSALSAVIERMFTAQAEGMTEDAG